MSGSVGTVEVIDISTSSLVNAIPVGDSPVQTEYNPFNGYIYVNITKAKYIDVIDISTNSAIKSIPVGTHSIVIAYNPNNHNIYVTNSHKLSSTISVK